jgi:membrane protease YdiL (CAAX protease family)
VPRDLEQPLVQWPWQDQWSERPGQPERPPLSGVGRGFQRNTITVGLAWVVGIFIVLQVIAAGILFGIESDPTDEAEQLTALLATLAADGVALVAIPLWLLGGRIPGLAAIRLHKPTWSAIGWGFAGLVLSYIALGIYLGVVAVLGIDALEPVSSIDDDSIYRNAYLVALTGVVVVFVAPIAEEIFFRGFLIGGITRRWSLIPAVAVSAIIFAAIHIDVGSLIPFAIIGVVFAYIYLRSGNLASSIVAHMLFNTIAFVGLVADRGVG